MSKTKYYFLIYKWYLNKTDLCIYLKPSFSYIFSSSFIKSFIILKFSELVILPTITKYIL